MEYRKFGKSENTSLARAVASLARTGNTCKYFGTLKSGSPEIQYFGSLVNRKFGNSKHRKIGKTEIQEIGKSERKGFLKNKRITAMSVSCFFTNTSGLPGLLATFILTDGSVGDGWVMGRSDFYFFVLLISRKLLNISR